MEYKEKINIYVPENVGELIKRDATLFEVFKKDGATINRNRFLSRLVKGYYSSYVLECRHKYESLYSAINEHVQNNEISHNLSEELLNQIILPSVPKRKGKNPAKLSLKPTAETESIIRKIINDLEINDYVSQYFCRMFMSYAEKPLYERERIIFKENWDDLLDACMTRRPISFSTIWNPKVSHDVVPYELSIGQDEMFNYLLCQEKNARTGKYEAKSYRLNRITGISYSFSTEILADDVVMHLEKMKKYGAQYPINDDVEICVHLSNYGMVSYNRIYHGRPKFDHIEDVEDGKLYYFKCSEDQVYLYFRRFEAGAAEIIQPASLRERMIKFHKGVLLDYKEDKGETI